MTKPQAGVMMTRPDTAPEMRLSTVGRPLASHSVNIQLSAPAAAQICGRGEPPSGAGGVRMWQDLAGCGRMWQDLAGCGRMWQDVAGSGRRWQDLAGCGRIWQDLAGSGRARAWSGLSGRAWVTAMANPALPPAVTAEPALQPNLRAEADSGGGQGGQERMSVIVRRQPPFLLRPLLAAKGRLEKGKCSSEGGL